MDKKSSFFSIIKPKISNLKLEIGNYNIHYINQADGADAIWAESTTWGTPEALTNGTYVVRVGDELGNVDETYFTIGSTTEPEQPPVQQGPKVIFKNGATLVEEVAAVDGKIVLTQTIPELAATENYVATAYEFVEWVKADDTAIAAGDAITEDLTVYPKFKAQIYNADGNVDMVYGDVNSDGIVNTFDRTYVHRYINGRALEETSMPISPLLKVTVGENLEEHLAGDVNYDNVINTFDRTYIHRYINGRPLEATGKNIYVINK